MRINSLYISAFGGIKNLKLDFSEGFNVIYGDNENGKSTIMAFIKMMFFGSDRGSTQVSKSIRKKSTPWDGSQMAGSVDFEHSGKRFRLEREFRTSNSTDKVTLIDLDLGTRQTVPADIGTKFFGLSPAAFERSVFIGQFGFPESDTSAEGELNSRLSNIALTGEESVSFETVYKRLETARLSLMSKSGRAGEYDKNLRLYNELKQRIEKASLVHSDFSNKKAQITALKQEIELLQKNADALKNQIGAEQDIKNAEKLKKFIEASNELEQLNDSLRLEDGSVLDEMFLRKLQFCISKLEAASRKLEAKQNEAASFEKSINAGLNPPKDATSDTASQLQKEITDLENDRKARLQKLEEYKQTAKTLQASPASSKIWLAMAGALFFVIGLALGILKYIAPAVCLAVLGAALIIIYFVLLSSAKKAAAKINEGIVKATQKQADCEAQIKAIENEIFSRRVRLEAINTALNSSATVIEKQKEMLKEAKTEAETLQKEKEAEEKVLKDLFARYKTAETEEILSLLEPLGNEVQKQKELKQQLSFLSLDLGNITKAEAEQKLLEIGNGANAVSPDFEKIKEKHETLLREISEKTSAAAALSAEARTAMLSAENPEELKSQLKALEEKIASQKEFCEVANIAMSALADSFAEVRRSYGSALEKKAGEIFSLLTGGKYESMSISKSFDINTSEKDAFGSREIAYLSSGTADQAYLSLRLALSALMAEEGEALPILLDDALAQYDDSRMKTALEFLKEYSEKTQIIMFTCHKAINEEANANKISLAK